MKSLLCAVLILPARADGPMGYLKTYGPAADPATRPNRDLLIISPLVTAIIGFLVLCAAPRASCGAPGSAMASRRYGPTPAAGHGST